MTHLRIWGTRLDVSRVKEYDRFVAEHSQPMFVAQRGFRGVIFSRSGEEVAVLSFWEDDDAVQALGKAEAYREAVRAIDAADFLTADSTVEVFEIHAGALTESKCALPAVDPTTASQ